MKQQMMKKVMINAVLMLLVCLASAQERNYGSGFGAHPQSDVIPMRVFVSDQKTTNLIFPYKVISVDRGSRSVIAQLPDEVDNIVQLKAASVFVGETNLTVITGDGSFYSFLLDYEPDPAHLNLKMGANQPSGERTAYLRQGKYAHEIKQDARAVYLKKAVKNRKARRYNMILQWTGTYIGGDFIYLRFVLDNSSNIPFDVGQLRLFYRDKKVNKRTAVQEVALTPEIIYGNDDRINAASANVLVIGLPKFTIPDKQRFHIQIMEEGGGRKLEMTLRSKDLERAAPITGP